MQAYVVRRLALVVPTLFGVTVIIFMAVRFLPGDVVDQIMGDYGAAAPEIRQQILETYSLDQNIVVQYGEWMGGILRGDFGTSIATGRSVGEEIQRRIGPTLQLGSMAMVLSIIVAIPIGVLSAVRQATWVDYVTRSFAILMLAIPSFWLALLILLYGFEWFGWSPPATYRSIFADPVANFEIMIAPALVLGANLAAITMRMTRSTMLEVLREDYIRTAWAKGLAGRTVVMRHALRNAVIPVVTVIGIQVPIIVGGTVILERIFSIPGMGSHLLTALSLRDYPVVQAIVLFASLAVILSNLLVDLSYTILDPRIRFS